MSWQKLKKAMEGNNAGEAEKLIGQMSAQDLTKDYSQLDWDQSPIHWAAYNGHEQVVKLLLDKKISLIAVVAEDKRTALHVAAWNGHTQIASLLLRNKAVIDASDKDGRTALHWAATSGKEQVADLLMKVEVALIDTK